MKKPREPFAYGNKDGSITVVDADKVYADSDPQVKAHPDLFEEVVPDKP